MGVSLLTVPTYIHLVGDARYGVLAVLWSFLGYFGLFDLGLGRATAQRVAALSHSSGKDLASTFWTALAMNAVLGVAGGALIWPISHYFFDHVISTGSDMRSELAGGLPWLMLAVPVMTISGVLGGALQGRAQFLEMNIISVSGSVLIQVLPLVVAWGWGPDLAWLIPSVILTSLFSGILMFWRCKVHVFHDHAPSISRHQAKSLLFFGGWVTITSLVGPLMVVLDRFVIGAQLGASAVTYYTVPFQLAQRSTMLPGALTSALFPRLAAAHRDEAKQLAAVAMRSLAAVMTPLILIAFFLIEPFLRFWITPEFASKAALTAQILFFGFWTNGLACVPFAKLQASGRPDAIAKCHLIELIPYLILLFLGLHLWGLPGGAAAFALRAFGDCGLLLWLAGLLDNGIQTLKMPALLLLIAFGAAVSLSIGSLMWWGAVGSLLLIVVAWSWWSAPADLRALAIRFAKKIFPRDEEARQ
jgi:O-antigen/teichoic acid export membrane protein